MNKTLKTIARILLSLLFWVGLWALISYRINNAFLFPSPKKVLAVCIELVKTPDFWTTAVSSLGRIMLGIISAVVIGIITAIITTRFSFADMLINPAMSVVKATPVASFAFVAFLFLGLDFLPVFITALLVLPIIWTNVASGIRAVPKELKEVTRIYKLSPLKKLTKLYIPSVLPYFLAACRSALGLAWKAGVAAEVLCPPRSAIGTEMYYAKTFLDTESLFAWTLFTIIFSLILEKSVIYLISRLPIKIPDGNTEVRA